MELVASQRVARKVARDVHSGVLNGIHAQGVAAALWDRPLDEELAAWLDMLPGRALPGMRWSGDMAALPSALDAALMHPEREKAGLGGIGDGRMKDWLAAEILELTGLFARVMDVGAVALRLDVVTGDACRRFHRDRMVARMLCTLRGSGTEYGPEVGPGQAGPVERMARGAVGLFRGSLWPGEETALLHRSPPIAGTGETRLLLVVDLPEAACDCGLPH